MAFEKIFIKKDPFLIEVSKISFNMCYVTEYEDVKPCETKMATLWIKSEILKKRLSWLGPKQKFFDILFKRLYKDCFEDLQINNN